MQSGVQIQANQWQFSGASTETIGPYTRKITFNPVCRDGGNNIALCPGAFTDLHSREVVVDVTWFVRGTVTNSVTERSYITNWDSQEWTQDSTSDFTDGDFGAPTPQTQLSTEGDGQSVTLKQL